MGQPLYGAPQTPATAPRPPLVGVSALLSSYNGLSSPVAVARRVLAPARDEAPHAAAGALGVDAPHGLFVHALSPDRLCAATSALTRACTIRTLRVKLTTSTHVTYMPPRVTPPAPHGRVIEHRQMRAYVFASPTTGRPRSGHR